MSSCASVLTRAPTKPDVLKALQHVRTALSKRDSPPIDEFLQSNSLDRVIQFANCDEEKEIQFEAVWILINVTSGNADQTRNVVEAGALKVFARILRSEHATEDIREQCVWAIANVVGDDVQYRDMCLKNNICASLLAQFERSPTIQFASTLIWCLSNFFRVPLQESHYGVARSTIRFLEHAILRDEKNCSNLVADAAWAFAYVTNYTDHPFHDVVASNARLVARLAQLATNVQRLSSCLPAIKILANLASGSREQTDAVVTDACFVAYKTLLMCRKKELLCEVCFLLSNVAAGTREQIQKLIDSKCVGLLCDALQYAAQQEKIEASHAIANLMLMCSIEQLQVVCTYKFVMSIRLAIDTVHCKSACLGVLQGVLRLLELCVSGHDELADILLPSVDEVSIVASLERLQGESDEDIAEIADEIIDLFFQNDDFEYESYVRAVEENESRFDFD